MNTQIVSARWIFHIGPHYLFDFSPIFKVVKIRESWVRITIIFWESLGWEISNCYTISEGYQYPTRLIEMVISYRPCYLHDFPPICKAVKIRESWIGINTIYGIVRDWIYITFVRFLKAINSGIVSLRWIFHISPHHLQNFFRKVGEWRFLTVIWLLKGINI